MKHDITKADAVFFDWDGTLVDSFAFLHGAHNHVRGVLDIEPFSLDVFKEYFGKPREELYTILYGDRREDAKKHFEEYVYANHAEHLKPLDAAQEVLEWFYNQGIPCGVVTNKVGKLVKAEIEIYGWDKYMVSVVGAGEAEQDKPSAAPLHLALENAGISGDLSNVWFVGDTDNDLKCAENAPCRSVLLGESDIYRALASKHKIDLYSENCRSFLDLLLQSEVKSLKA